MLQLQNLWEDSQVPTLGKTREMQRNLRLSHVSMTEIKAKTKPWSMGVSEATQVVMYHHHSRSEASLDRLWELVITSQPTATLATARELRALLIFTSLRHRAMGRGP